MLTVYSTQGSPGASTTALHLAAHWASEGREVLLIEADPAGGSLSHNLGIQFTPGSASFVASGLPVQSNHLIDHAQDVLFESLHVMPTPASPTGARGIFNAFADFSEQLRTISENEMAVIIDGGQITADTAASGLTTAAAGVVVVCRDNSQLSSLELLREAVSAGPDGDGPAGCAVSIGKSPMSPEEWQENCGLTFCGSIEAVPGMAADLSTYLARSKRKSKKWRASLEQVGESLYVHAQPPVSSRPRARPPEPVQAPGTEPAGGDGPAMPADATPDPAAPDPAALDPAALDPAAYGQAPPMAPAAGAGYGQPHYLPPAAESQPAYGQPHYLPPTGWPGDPQAHGEAPPADFPAYGQAPPPAYPPAPYPPQPYEQPPAYQPPPQPYEQPPAYQPPPQPYEQPPAYQPPAQPAHEQPPKTYEQGPPGALETHPPAQQPPAQPQPSQPAYEQPPAQPPQQAQPYEQPPAQPPQPAQPYEQPPAQPEQPGPAAPQPETAETDAVPRPNLQPTGSFRDWAVKLHGSNAQDATARRGG